MAEGERERGRVSPFRDSSDRCLISPMPSTNTSDYSTLESFQVDLLLPFNCSFPASPGYWRFVSSSLSLFLSIRLFARSNEIADIYIYIMIWLGRNFIGGEFRLSTCLFSPVERGKSGKTFSLNIHISERTTSVNVRSTLTRPIT